jgi:ABC-type dipeptide/oligopeptide/nickel transport system ATPase component
MTFLLVAVSALAFALTADLALTDDLAGARRLADRMLVIADGRIVETKPMAAFFDHAAHPASRALLEAILP